jgi:hypothetical protein
MDPYARFNQGDRVQILTPHWNGAKATVSSVYRKNDLSVWVFVHVDGWAKPGIRDGLAIFHASNVRHIEGNK